MNLNLSITNGIVSTKIYDKRDDFDLILLISLSLIAMSLDLNNRNKFLTAKLLTQGYRYHKLRKAFSKFFHRHYELIEKYNVSLKKRLQQGISEPVFMAT